MTPAWVERFALTGRRALVTGASKGIGAEIARTYAEAGADVALVARDRAGLEATAAAVRDAGRRTQVIQAELADPAAARAAALRAEAEWDGIDILLNAAGIARIAPAAELTLADWDAVMAVNLRAPFVLAQALGPGMIARRWGKIVNVSSQTGVIALDDHAAYASSKGGLNALTKSLAAEWARHNVQVNAICPTVILTPMGREVWSDEAKAAPLRDATPLRRFGEPQEVADAALYLASPAAELVNGATLMLEGGFTSV